MIETKCKTNPNRTPSGKEHVYRQMKHRQAERQYIRYKYQKRFHSLLLMIAIVAAIAGMNGYQYLVSHVSGLFHFSNPFQQQPLQQSFPASLSFDDFSNQLNIVPLYVNFMPVSLNLSQLSSKLLPILPQQEDTTLREKLERLFAQYSPRFTPHLYYFNPENREYVSINGFAPVSAASVIKLPLLYLYFQQVDNHTLSNDTQLLFQEYQRAGGSGDLQYRPAGEVIPAGQIVRQMIQISDNTCTNMMISYLGGTELVNYRLQELGLEQTQIRNWLPDLNGTNTISPYEMSTILYNLDQGYQLSQDSKMNALDILKGTHNRRLLPARLPKGAIVAHKTGDIGDDIGDSGIVFLPDNQKHYFISIQVERPYNDYTARDIIQQASQIIYDHVANQPLAFNNKTSAS